MDKNLLVGVTPGPWKCIQTPDIPKFGELAGQWGVWSDSLIVGYGSPPLSYENAHFIAECRNELPSILNAMKFWTQDAMMCEIDRLNMEVDRLNNMLGNIRIVLREWT